MLEFEALSKMWGKFYMYLDLDLDSYRAKIASWRTICGFHVDTHTHVLFLFFRLVIVLIVDV